MEIMKIPANTPINANNPRLSEAAPASDRNFLSVLMSLTGSSRDIASEKPGMPMSDGFPDDDEHPMPIQIQDGSILASYMAAEALADPQFMSSQDTMQPNASDAAELPVTQAVRPGAENIRFAADVSGFQTLNGFTELTKHRSLQAAQADTDAPVNVEAPVVRSDDFDTAYSTILRVQPLVQNIVPAKAAGVSATDYSIDAPGSLWTSEPEAVLPQSGTAPEMQMLMRTPDLSVYRTTNTVRLTALNAESDASASLYTERQTGDFGTRGQVNYYEENPDISVEVISHKEGETPEDARTLFESFAVQAQRVSKSGVKQKTLTDAAGQDELGAASLKPELLRTGALLESQQTEKLEESVLYTTEGDTISQVRTGIEQKLDSEDTEFVIKLKPEGLGEITVEMARRNGRIELNLIASSSETEKLLSGSIERLRESLRVYNADIARVGFSQPETQPYAFLTDHSAFSYSEESQRQWRSSEDHRRVNAQGSAEAVSKVSELGTEPVLGYERSLLNRYA